MKHIIILLTALLMSVVGYADVVREGNIITTTKTTSVNDKPIDILYQDKQGKQHTIYQSKNNSFYIMKTSKKTGKEYKYYLPKELQESLRKELKLEKK